MDSTQKTITIRASVRAPLEQVWELWTKPEHIIHWNFASDDWRCPSAINDLREGGRLSWRMEALDGSQGFDFAGTYDEVVPLKRIRYTIDDGRKTIITFTPAGDVTEVVETFDIEGSYPIEMQRDGWQAILDNFKKYAESQAR